MKKISVIIPLYNKSQYILRAVDSAINQTSQVNEIIVVDDGSTDGGGYLLQGQRKKSVRVIHQENRGECEARNRGIMEAKNDYLAFLDADDEWKPEFIGRIQSLIEKYPGSGAFATSTQIIKPDQSIISPKLVNIPSEPWTGIIPNFFDLFQAGYAFNSSSIVIPKRVLQEVGGFPPGVAISGDVTCWVKIALRYPIAFDPARSVIYHQEAQSRVGHVYKPLKEMPYIELIISAHKAGTIPDHLESEALEFVAQKQIMVAKENIMSGNPSYARRLLSTCKTTKRYRWSWFWWRFWAALPPGWPNHLMLLKQKILSPNQKIHSGS